jgi:transposase
LPESEGTCPKDGTTLIEIGVEVSEQIDIVFQQVRVIRHEGVANHIASLPPFP